MGETESVMDTVQSYPSALVAPSSAPAPDRRFTRKYYRPRPGLALRCDVREELGCLVWAL
ncbi:hypothetical protein GCM10025790_14060 [Nesterenkonia rhizosphaerae]|uniref:Uncharacterized protein n=1 Tax=Nesterenkonia rhizosphaerae TaxID=1348272 RepID=A0ABP9FW87_9MICC